MTFGLLAKALPMKGLMGGALAGGKGPLGGIFGGKGCDNGPGHGHPGDGGTGQEGAIKLPAIPGDTTGVTFHFDLDGDGAINGAADENIYVARGDLDVKGTPGLDDYYKVAANQYGTEHPGAKPDTAVGKATIYGPGGQESYYHFTGDEFGDDGTGAGSGGQHHGHDHAHGGRFCDDRDDDDRNGHGKGDHDKGGHDKGDHDKGGHDKGGPGRDGSCGPDKIVFGKIGLGGIIQGKIEFGKAVPDHGDAGKDGHGHGGTDCDYWKDAGDFFKGLCKPGNGGHDDDRDDHADSNDDDGAEGHGHGSHDPMFC